MPVPAVLAPWRAGPPSDRELIRQYLAWPATGYNLTQITAAMNRMVGDSPDTIPAIQGWIDETETLTQDWADKISDGTAHLGNVAEYEGPAPGVTLTRDDLKKKVDVLEWDTSLNRRRVVTGGRADATEGGVIAARIGHLKAQIVMALGLQPAGGGGARLVRS
jgi:hypothetical protein